MISLKNEAQLSAMKVAGRISAEALALAISLVRPGITTAEIDKKVEHFIRAQGATPSFLGYGGFPGSTCISVNNEVIHGIPGSRIIREGDVVSIDVGAFIGGYHGDNAGTCLAGEASQEAKRLLAVTEQSLYDGIQMAVIGNRIGDISAAVQKTVEEAGFSVVTQFVGHGIGQQMHEEPEVPNFGPPGRGPRLAAGMTIAIEPMVNAVGGAVRVLDDDWTVVTESGSLSAHFEHTIAVTKDGPLILTKVQTEDDHA